MSCVIYASYKIFLACRNYTSRKRRVILDRFTSHFRYLTSFLWPRCDAVYFP